MGTDLREFCLKWNNHHNTLIAVLDSLLERERLVDVTLAAEGQFINVHRIVLFACSQYFEELLSQLPEKQAVVFLKDVQFVDLKALVDYMYKGEVNVSQDRLAVFLQTAEALKIKGLINKQQQKKFAASLPDNFVPSRTRARMNGPKVSHTLSQYSDATTNENSTSPSSETKSLKSPAHCMVETAENEMEGQEEEEIEPGVMVAEMEPDDNFVSAYGKRDTVVPEFDDDQFEATEHWSSQDAEDEFWNTSQEGFNGTATDDTNDNIIGEENWNTELASNDTTETLRPKRKRKSVLNSSSTVSSTATKGQMPSHACPICLYRADSDIVLKRHLMNIHRKRWK